MRKTIQMTHGPIGPSLIVFILPLIENSIFQQLYNTADFLFVSNLLGKTAAAAVGASSTLVTCSIGLFSGIAVGAEVVIAFAIGAGDEERANRILHTALPFGMFGGFVLMCAGIFWAPSMLILLNTPESILPQAVLYIRIYFLSIPANILYNMCASALRACGNSATPFRILACFGMVNVAANALFIGVLSLGIAGAALATILCQWSSLAAILHCLRRGEQKLRFSWNSIHCSKELLAAVLRIGLPTGIQTIVITLSNIVVQYYINGFGETAVAAFSTYYKIENFIYLPIMAFGQAITSFSSQNTGIGNFRRVGKGTAIAAGFGVCVTLCIAGGVLLFSERIFSWFMRDDAVRGVAISIAFVSFPFYWLYPLMEVLGGSLRGMGYAVQSMSMILINLCGLRITLLSVFTRHFRSLYAIASVYPITWATATISFAVTFFIILYRKIHAADIP